MIKNIIFFILTICTLNAFAQKESANAKRINIPGTKVFLIPPPMFHTVAIIKGVQSDTSIQRIEISDIKAGYPDIEGMYKREALESMGYVVRHFSDTIFHGYKAKVMCYVDSAKKEVTNLLLFGDNTFSIGIGGLCTPADSSANVAILRSILSSVYKKNFKIDPFYAAPFKINDKDLMFQFRQSEGQNRYYFTYHGEDPDTTKARAGILIIVTPNPMQESLKELSDRMIRSLQMKDGTWEAISTSDTTVNGYACREVIIHVADNEYKTMHYLLTMANGKDALTVLAGAADKYDTYIPQFRKFAAAVRFK